MSSKTIQNIRQNQQQQKNAGNEQMDYTAKSSPWHLVSFTHAGKNKDTS